MAHGVVAWFNNVKSYGFITPHEGKDVFVHYSEILMDGYKTLDQGDKVEFDTDTKDGRIVATNVRVVEKGQNGTRSNSDKKQQSR